MIAVFLKNVRDISAGRVFNNGVSLLKGTWFSQG
jgi:hypothetical protein